MAAWIMACRICFQVIFFELFIGIFVLKDLFFSVIPDKDEESVGIKTIAFRFFTLFRTTVLFQKGRSLQKYRSTSEQPFHFRKTKYYQTSEARKVQAFSSVLSSGPEASPVRSTVFFPAFRALTTSLAAFRVGTRLNTLSFSKLRKRVPAFQRTFRSSTWMAGLYVSSDSAPMLLI